MISSRSSWRAVPLPADVPIGSDPRTARAGEAVHVFAARPAGDGVSHVRVGPDRVPELLADLPLATVSGAAAGPDGPVVAGASLDHAAVVLDVSSGRSVVLADPGSVAAWPVPVTGSLVRIAWATGGSPATVWVGELSASGVAARRTVLEADAVLGLRAVGWRNGIDLLCDCLPTGLTLVRAGADEPVRSAAPLDATLAPGCLLIRGRSSIELQSLDDGTRETIRLPERPDGQGRRVTRVGLADNDLLTWTTERIDEPEDVESRGFVARLDPARTSVGPAVALPAPGRPAAVHVIGGQLAVVQPAGGRLVIWVGDQNALRPGAN